MKTINGNLLKSMLISATNNLFNHYPEIDALNVFPVPDGDTGMNMNLTMSSGAKEIQNRAEGNVYDVAKNFSRGLLMGARGNSGVITSQIFRGFAEALEGVDEIKPLDLARAFKNAKEVSYKAVMRPIEGTILTVIRECSEFLAHEARKEMSIEETFAILLNEAKASLERTPELLPVLKEVGVVDSGGAGLVTILEGMNSAIHGVVIDKSSEAETNAQEINVFQKAAGDNEEFGYCTEFIMRLGSEPEKKPFVEKRFTNVLLSHGNSLAVVMDEDIVKVHVHTLKPGNILTYAQQFGEFVTLKIENMTEQHHNLNDIINEQSTKEETKDTPLKEHAIIAVSVGEGVDNIFKELGVDEIVSGGQTMNPSTEDFIEAIKRVHAKNVYILPNNSNIVMAASQACEVCDENLDVKVIPSKTIPQGIVAAMMFSSNSSSEENANEMKAALKNVKSGSVTYAIKDTDIDGMHVTKDYYMGIQDKLIVTCVKDKFESLYNLLDSMIDEESAIITIITGEDVTDEELERLNNEVEEKYKDIDVEVKKGGQPVYSFYLWQITTQYI